MRNGIRMENAAKNPEKFYSSPNFASAQFFGNRRTLKVSSTCRVSPALTRMKGGIFFWGCLKWGGDRAKKSVIFTFPGLPKKPQIVVFPDLW